MYFVFFLNVDNLGVQISQLLLSPLNPLLPLVL